MSINQKTASLSGWTLPRRVLLITGIILVAANMRPSLTSVGPLIEAIRTDTGISHGLAGLLTTLPLLAFAILSPLAPKLARRFTMELTLLASLIFLAVGILVRSAFSVTGLFTGTALLGLAIAVINVLLPSLIKRDFPDNVGLMTGVYTTSMSTLGAIGAGTSVPLAFSLGLGWSGGLASWAVLSLVAIVVWLPQLRHLHRSSAGLMQRTTSPGLWRSRLAWLVTLFMGVQSLAFYCTITWLPEVLHDHGINATKAGWILSLVQVVGLPANLLVPTIAGKLTSQRGLSAIIVLFLVVGYAGLFIGGTKLIILWAILIGIGLGGSISLALAFIALRATDNYQVAELSGMAQSIGYLLAAVGPILFGFLHDLTHSWTMPLGILVISSVIQFFIGLGAGRNAYVTTNTSS